jgi:hypothetical protein
LTRPERSIDERITLLFVLGAKTVGGLVAEDGCTRRALLSWLRVVVASSPVERLEPRPRKAERAESTVESSVVLVLIVFG